MPPYFLLVVNLIFKILTHQNFLTILFFSSLFFTIMVRKLLFGGQFFEFEIMMYLYVFRSPELKMHIFKDFSLCLSWNLCVCVCLLPAKLKNK